MTEIRAFVAHSFAEQDKDIVQTFLGCFEEIKRLNPNFSWETAERAEAKDVAQKVLHIFANKNLFIGICTKKERVISPEDLRQSRLRRRKLNAEEQKFLWKTSDWAIQEIGLAMGKQIPIVLIVEDGVRSPGELQGNLECIRFERQAPEKALVPVLQMITNQFPSILAERPTALEPVTTVAEAKHEEPVPQERPFPTPKLDWNRIDWEVALTERIMGGDTDGATTIYDGYLKTDDATKGDNKITWQAHREYTRIWLGKGGHLQNLKDLAGTHPENAEVLRYLAEAEEHFDAHDCAASTYKLAASKASGSRKLALLSAAAKAYAIYGAAADATATLDEMRREGRSIPTSEVIVLSACLEVADRLHDSQASLAAMERLTEINPDDDRMIFQLARKHGACGNNDLCLLHYLRIQDRGSGTWNNIGVAAEKLSLPARSIAAFEKSEELGETLATSNMARSLVDAGFLKDAAQRCRAAMKIEGFHENIGRILARVGEVQSQEDKKEAEILTKAKRKSEFYRRLGRAAMRSRPDDIGPLWQSPNCILSMTVMDGTLVAKGSYKQSRNPLGRVSLYSLGNQSTPDEIVIEYRGSIRGCAIEGDVTRNRNGEAVALLLASSDQRATILMILADDGTGFDVMENPQSNTPSYYSITRTG